MDNFARAHLVTGPHALPVDQDCSLADGPLDFRPGGILNMGRQEEIEPLLSLPWRDGNVENRVQVSSPGDDGVSLGVDCGTGWPCSTGVR